MSLHWTPEEYKAYLHKGQPAPQLPPLTEKAWQGAVIRMLQAADFSLMYHTFDSRRSPSGFPDLIAVRREPGHPLLAIEAKTDIGQVTAAQQAWLAALAGCTGVVAEVWRPSMLQEIVARLRDP